MRLILSKFLPVLVFVLALDLYLNARTMTRSSQPIGRLTATIIPGSPFCFQDQPTIVYLRPPNARLRS